MRRGACTCHRFTTVNKNAAFENLKLDLQHLNGTYKDPKGFTGCKVLMVSVSLHSTTVNGHPILFWRLTPEMKKQVFDFRIQKSFIISMKYTDIIENRKSNFFALMRISWLSCINSFYNARFNIINHKRSMVFLNLPDTLSNLTYSILVYLV